MLQKFPIIQKLISYLVTGNVPADSSLVRIALIVSAVLLGIGLLGQLTSYRIKKIHLRTWLRSIGPVLALGGFGWSILLLLRFEDLEPFDRRIWVYVWLIPVVIFAWFRLNRLKKTLPVHKVVESRYKRYDKYLPKQKRTST